MASNWRQTFEELKKKKKEIDKAENKKEINNINYKYNNITNNKTMLDGYANNKPLRIPNTVNTTPIPTTKKEEDKKWYQKIFTKGNFEDGYDFGDVTKTILGTVTDITQDVTKGAFKVIEAPADIVTNVVASGVGLFSDKTADKIRDFADNDLSEKFSNVAANMNPVGMVSNIVNGTPENTINPMGIEYDKDKSFTENYKEGIKKAWGEEVDTNDYEKSSTMGYYADKTAELVGYTIGMIFGGKALSGGKTASVGSKSLGASANAGNIGVSVAGKTLNIPTLAITGGMASGLEEANSKEGVTEAERWSKATSSGLIEGITEGIFGMFGVGGVTNEAGKEVFDVIGEKIAKPFTSRAMKVIANVGVKSFGESIEEFLSYTFNHFADNGIIDKLGEADFSSKYDWGEVGEQMALAFISSMIVQGGGSIIETNSAIAEAEKQLGRKLTKQEKATVTQASIEGTLEEKVGKLQVQVEEQELEREEKEQDPIIEETQQEEITEETPNAVIPPTVEQELTNITNQIDELETMLDTSLTATQQQEILAQLGTLNQKYNELVQQNGETQQQAEFRIANNKNTPQQEINLENTEIGPVQAVNTEQINNTTTQETKSNSLTEVESNTPNVVKSAKTEQKMTEDEIAPIKERRTANSEVAENLQDKSVNDEHFTYEEYGKVSDSIDKIEKEIKGKYDKEYKAEYDKLYKEFEDLRNAPDSEQKGNRLRKLQSLLNGGLRTQYDNKIEKELNEKAKDSIDRKKKLQDLFDVDFKEALKQADRKTPTQEELDNLEDTRKNKSGSEYASAFYELEKKYGSANLYKGLNSYKSTGKALAEELAPVKETIEDLTDTIKETNKAVKNLAKEMKEVKKIAQEGKPLTLEDLEDFYKQTDADFRAITEANAPMIQENTTPEYQYENDNEGSVSRIESPLIAEGRDMENVGSRKVKAYQYENPEVRPYFQEMARHMMYDLDNSTKGERIIIGDISQTGGGDFEYSGVKRNTTPDIADLLDNYNYTYADIRKGLKAIIEDHGAENIAVSKRIEFALDDRLRNGFTAVDGLKIPPNQEYIDLLNEKGWVDYYNSIPDSDIAPIETNLEQDSVIAPTEENVAKTSFTEEEIIARTKRLQEFFNEIGRPVDNEFIEELNKQSIEWARESGKLNQSLAIEQAPTGFDNGGPMIRVSPEMQNRTLNTGFNNKNVDWEALEDTSKGEQQALVKKKLGETLEQRDVDWDSLEDTSNSKQKQYNPETGQLEDAIEKKTKKEIKEKLLKETGILNANLDEANKIPKALMENTDPIRLQEMIFGRGLGTQINDMFFQKVKDNTSEKIRFQNKERAEIKNLGIKARSKESAAVQKYGEKQWVNEYGELVPYGDKELASEFPNLNVQNQIKRASQIIRQKYDSYLDTTNKVLTELGYDAIPKRDDYMRHFQELNDIFSRVGIPYNYNEMTSNDLPTDINGLTHDFSPSKNFFANALRRTGNKTTYDAITGIDGYLEGIGNLIYHTEDIQRLRAYEQYIRDTYGQNHGFDNIETLSDEQKAERIEKIQNNHLSNYASWLHEYTNTLAGKKSLVDRGVEHFVGRRIYSFLNTTKSQVGKNMIGFNIGSAMTNAIAGVQALAKTNKLAAAKGLADTVKNIFRNDGFVNKNNFLTSRFGSESISKNWWQKAGDAGFIFMQGMDHFVSNFVVRSKYNELKSKGLSDEQAHIEAGKFASRLMSDRSQGAMANIYNSQMLGIFTQFQNEVNNQLYSMFYDTYHESRESAQGNALKTTAGMTFTLGQLAIFTHIFGQAFEKMAGYNPTFDIIGILMKAFGFDDDEDSEDTVGDNLEQAFKRLGEALPYISIFTGGGRIPISEALPIQELFTGKDEFGNDKSRWETLKETLPYYVLPTGYSQIKKTTQGLGMYDEDLPIAGSYTDSGNLRFTADESDWGKIQAGVFGQWANDEAQAYVDSEFKTIKKESIDELIDLGMKSSDYRKLKEKINKAGKSNEDKVDYISTLNELTDSQKNTLVNNILDRDYNVDVSNYEDYGSYDEFNFYYTNREKYDWLKAEGISYEEYSATDESKELYNYAYKYPETYKVGKAITGDFATYKEYADYIWDLKADKDENGNSISGTKKTKVINYVNGLDLSIPQKAMLIRKTYSSFDDYNIQIVEYVSDLDIGYDDKKSILEELDMKVLDDGTVTWE